jgi:hypothetical protein
MPLAAVDIAKSLQRALDALLGFLPNILGFLVILVVGYLIAKAVKALVTKGLQKLGVDRALHQSDAAAYVERVSPGASPSRLIGAVAFWFIFLFAISAAIGALKIPALTGFLAQVQGYLPDVIAAVLIFVVAAALAGAAGGLAHRLMGDTPTGRIVRAVAPALILAIGAFMILSQLQVAAQIVTITYAALMGMLALAGALAFGLGGRDVAARMLEDAYRSGRENRDQVRRDMELARERARTDAQRAAQTAGSGQVNGPAGSTAASGR